MNLMMKDGHLEPERDVKVEDLVVSPLNWCNEDLHDIGHLTPYRNGSSATAASTEIVKHINPKSLAQLERTLAIVSEVPSGHSDWNRWDETDITWCGFRFGGLWLRPEPPGNSIK
ncbi:hypothetical protein YC2023_054326 [Brassica napus]